MKLFDGVLSDVQSMLVENKMNKIDLKNILPCEKGDKNDLIFKEDMAYELGGSPYVGLGGVFLTSHQDFSEDEVYLLGDDLTSISSDRNYARIVIAKVNENKMGQGNELYQSIRRVEYISYHINPKDFMLRISNFNRKESIRVSKQAIKNKRNFASLGKFFIDTYKQNPVIENVKIIFVTDPTFNYEGLKNIIEKNENIISALDHLLNKVKMDCHVCKLQEICAEVEEMVNEDFHKENK